ncbi:MAG: oligosaccharide flippase family protein [Nitrospirota bacterium]|nr:oligosaccharide flippase family protein [Nitrospirota bacterium]
MKITELRHRLKTPLYRNSIFLMANTVMTSGLGFFFWIIVARSYTVYEVGVGTAVISSVRLLALISMLGFNITMVRFLSKSEKPQEFINSCFTIIGIVNLVVSGIFIAGLDLWSPRTSFVQDNVAFILAFLFFSLGWSLSALMDSIFVAMRRADLALIKNTIFSLLKIPLPIILTIFFHAFGIVSSWGLAIGIALIISFFLFLPRVQHNYRFVPRLNLGTIKEVWEYSAGNYFVSFFHATSTLALPLIVVNLLPYAEQNAFFYVAWTIATLLFALPYAVSVSLFAEGSHFEDSLRANTLKAFRFLLVLLIPAIIVLVLSGKWLLLLFGESYSTHGLTLLRILTFSSIFVGINQIYYTILRVRHRMRELIAIAVFEALAVLITSGLIVRETGIVGVGYTWIGAEGLISLYVISSVWLRLRTVRARSDNNNKTQQQE